MLLSSAFKYGLIDGTEKAEEIGLTDIGKGVTQREDPARRTQALRQAALKPSPLGQFMADYKNKKLPSDEMLPKILTAQYGVPGDLAGPCGQLIVQNARFTAMLRDIGGSPHVLMDGVVLPTPQAEPVDTDVADDEDAVASHMDHAAPARVEPHAPTPATPAPPSNAPFSKPIFVGHGKNTVPLQRLESLLSTFQIPYKVTVKEAHLGRPIPQKVKDTMLQCGSAILIFTKDSFLSASDHTEARALTCCRWPCEPHRVITTGRSRARSSAETPVRAGLRRGCTCA